MITKIKLDLYAIMIYHSANFKSMHPFESYWGEAISLPYILPQQQKLCRKRAVTWPKFWIWLPISNLTCILQWYILLQISIKSMHPCKSYWSETNINTPTKTKSKKVHNSAKIWRMITNTPWPVFYGDTKLCKVWMKSMHPFKCYWAETTLQMLWAETNNKN